MQYRALPTYLLLAFCTAAPAFGAQHPMQPCHVGEKWSVYFAGLADGDFAYIPAGMTIVLDVATPNLGGIFVEGSLVFNHTAPSGTVHLKSAYVVVTGTLQIGCKVGPAITRFTKNAYLTLIMPERYLLTAQDPLTDGVNWPALMENRFINVAWPQLPSPEVKEAALDRGLVIVGTGELYIFGNDARVKGWTTLAETAEIDDDVLTLDDAPLGHWKLYDELVIASTDFEYADQWVKDDVIPMSKWGGHPEGYSQGEERFIAAFTAIPEELVLNQILDHQHWSGTTTVSFASGTYSITEKGEVGNLTRSVVVRGEESAYSSVERGGTRHSGHVILMMEEGVPDVPYCEVDWAEFRNLGVEGKLGRYPFHWHMLGDARHGTGLARPYLRDSSIHHCINRFVTVHNTSYVDVERNVGYDTLGGGFFLEDAEDGDPLGDQVQFVLLKDNLGLKVGRPQEWVEGYPPAYKELETMDPSVFWIQHPNQRVEGNHAAGAAGHGFYLAPNALADDYSHLDTEESYFRNNVAHSNGQHGFYHQSRVKWGYDANATGAAHEPAGKGLTAWKNRRYGIWWRTYGVSLLDGCSAANNKSGIYPASEGRQDAWRDALHPPTSRLIIRNATVFGETANVGESLNPAEAAAGRALPQTYWNFRRPDSTAPADAHEQPWDALNAIEAYDGQNVLEDFRIANFLDRPLLPDPSGGTATSLLAGAGVTQVEYNSRYAEDPRCSLEEFEFNNVAHPVWLRVTDPDKAFNMIRNTVVQDLDDSLNYGGTAGGQWVFSYPDPFYAANCSSLQVIQDPVNQVQVFPIDSVDFAQIEVRANTPAGVEEMTVSIRDLVGVQRSLLVRQLVGGGWIFNASLGLHDGDPATQQTGIYTIAFSPPGQPTQYDIEIEFCEREGVPTILGLPFAALPGTPPSNNGSPLVPVGNLNGDTVTDVRDLLLPISSGGIQQAFHYDSTLSVLFIKITTSVRLSSGSAEVEGTSDWIEVRP